MQQDSTPVDRLYSDFTRVLEQIDAAEISLRISAEEIFQKSLYVAIGSHFEQRITHHLLELMGRASSNNVLVTEFARIKGVAHQYHTYFEWDNPNANKFFSMFGREFRNYMTEYVRNNDEYRDAIIAFKEIGGMRNEVAHDFGTVIVEKTVEEIYSRYRKALMFVEQIPLRFEAFLESRQSPDSE